MDAREKALSLIKVLEKEREKAIEEIHTLKEKNTALKRSRVTWAMAGVGGGFLLVGAANLGVGFGLLQGEARTYMVTVGMAAVVAGAGLITLAFLR